MRWESKRVNGSSKMTKLILFYAAISCRRMDRWIGPQIRRFHSAFALLYNHIT